MNAGTRVVAALAVLTLGTAATVNACSFPELDFVVLDAGEGGPGETDGNVTVDGQSTEQDGSHDGTTPGKDGGDGSTGVDGNAGVDAGDSGGDGASGTDGATADGGDAGPTDGGLDSGTDAGVDSGTDSGVDAGKDSGVDSGVDSGTDAGVDSGTDAGHDSGTTVDAGCTLCDCDGDGFELAKPGCSTPVGLTDCDDYDDRINPDAGYSDEDPSTSSRPNGDWNCDGTVSKFYPTTITCSGLTCGQSAGFKDAPGCGAAGSFVTCKSVVIVGCQDDQTSSTTKQQCK